MVSTLEEAAPTVAVQALKQAAKLLVPSGQHGQGLGSSAIGIVLAQGISVLEAAAASGIAVATWANATAWAANST